MEKKLQITETTGKQPQDMTMLCRDNSALVGPINMDFDIGFIFKEARTPSVIFILPFIPSCSCWCFTIISKTFLHLVFWMVSICLTPSIYYYPNVADTRITCGYILKVWKSVSLPPQLTSPGQPASPSISFQGIQVLTSRLSSAN